MGLRTVVAALPLASPLYAGAGGAPVPVPFERFTEDGAAAEAASQDPLCRSALSARLLSQCRAMAEAVAAAPSALRGRQVLLLHGESDELAELPAVERFVSTLDGSATELRTFPRMRHDPFAERRKENVFAALREWVGHTGSDHGAH
jgi:alpha-beta hydrolase superfamily lysophospholipase